ncbi:MAG TPA: right-handed parallel beta-helix repeat-containing protein [Thermoanaerobaculia bacterium]|nr:right-handed parallel beta-helix repeat-containing protein [Thermoanaerobaculia bacterium]
MRYLTITLGAVLLFAATADAATYFVATTGSDTTGNGSVTAPYLTIKQATRVVKPGDEVVVRAGTYYDESVITCKGTASAPIVIRAAQGEKVILDGSRLPAGTDLFTLHTTDWVDFSGFEVRNATRSAVVLWHAKNTRVLDNDIHHAYRNGIYVGGDVTPAAFNITISGNQVHDSALANQAHALPSGGWPAAVVVSRTEGATVTGNRIYNNDGEGLIALRSTSQLIEGNEISDNFSMNLYLDNATMITANANLIHSSNPRYFRNGKPAAGIGVANETKDVMNWSSDNTFTNNIVVGTRWGFYYGNYESGGGLRNTKVVNNTFYGSVEHIIQVDASSQHSNSVVQNNIFHATTSPTPDSSGAGAGVSYSNNLWFGGNAGAAAGPGDVTGDPLFANPGGRTAADYKIRAGSAAIAKALNVTSLLQRDHFGTLRVAPFDIGAHQFSVAQLDLQAPTVPANLRATGGNDTSVALAWNAATDNVGVSGYSIVRNGVTVATIAGTTWTDRAVGPNTMYLYQVLAHDAAGNRSAPSAVLSLAWRSSHAETPPAAPVLTSPRRTATSIALQWNVVENATSFRIYRDGVEIATTPWYDFTDGNLTPSTLYSYTVVAVDKDGRVSPESNTVGVKTQAANKGRAVRH